MKTDKELAVMLLSALYAHNAELATKIGRTETSTSEPISAEQAAKDYKTIHDVISDS